MFTIIPFLNHNFTILFRGAPIAQLGKRWTPDRKVVGSILTRGTVLCP